MAAFRRLISDRQFMNWLPRALAAMLLVGVLLLVWHGLLPWNVAAESGDDPAPAVDVIIINVRPRAEAAQLSTSEDTPLTGAVFAADGNEHPLTYTIEVPPDHGIITITDRISGSFVYTPTLNYHGSDSFTFRATDPGDLYDTAEVAITVNPVNDLPVFTSMPVLTATAGITYTYAITATDADSGDTLQLTAPVSPTWLTLSEGVSTTAVLSGVPRSADIGTHPVELRASDEAGASATQPFTVTVLPPDEAHLDVSISSSAEQVRLGDILTYTVLITNTGPALARDVAATLSLPDGLVLSSVSSALAQAPTIPNEFWVCSYDELARQNTCTRPPLDIDYTAALTTTTRVVLESGLLTTTVSVEVANPPPGVARFDAASTVLADSTRYYYLPWARVAD
jgi:uncharacterized repeat protein (TIGR01451 family)